VQRLGLAGHKNASYALLAQLGLLVLHFVLESAAQKFQVHQPAVICRAAARAVRMQPGRNVPSSERLPLAPPPPKPAASPTQYRPLDGPARASQHAAVQVGLQAAQALARDELHLDGDERPRAAFAAARACRCAACPAPTGARAGCGGSGRRCAAWRRRKVGVKGGRPWPAALAGRTSCEAVSAFILAARPVSVSSTRKWRLSAAICLTSRWLPSSVSLRNSGNCMSRMRWLCSAPEMANSLAAMRQLSKCQVQGFSCAATRWHSQCVSKPVTSGSGPMRSPRWLSHSADLQGMVERPCPRSAETGAESLPRSSTSRPRV
jgi:hypothetical protein